MQRQSPELPFSNTGSSMAPTEEDRKPSAGSMKGEDHDAHPASSKDETPPSGLLAGQELQQSETVVSSLVAAAVARLPESSHGGSENGMSSEVPKNEGKTPSGHAFDQMENVDLPKFVKDHKGTLTFPEKLMLMLIHIERYFTKQGWRLEKAPIAWTRNGRAFIIRDNDKLVSDWLPIFFQKGKFSSFKRKLYRWGFRQVQLLSHDLSTIGNRELVFGNENFQRDHKVLLPRMKSVTAESQRRQEAAAQKEQRKEAGAVPGAAKAAPEQEQQLINGLAHQNQQSGVLQSLTALLSQGDPPPPPPPPPPPRPQQQAYPTASELALFMTLLQGANNNMGEQHQPSVATESQQSLDVVPSLWQGADSTTLQQILHNIQKQHRRQQQQEELVKNIHRMMFPSQQPAPASLDSTSNQSMLARLILQQLGGFRASGH